MQVLGKKWQQERSKQISFGEKDDYFINNAVEFGNAEGSSAIVPFKSAVGSSWSVVPFCLAKGLDWTALHCSQIIIVLAGLLLVSQGLWCSYQSWLFSANYMIMLSKTTPSNFFHNPRNFILIADVLISGMIMVCYTNDQRNIFVSVTTRHRSLSFLVDQNSEL